MKLPYGIAHFGELRREGYFLSDKTRYLSKLEQETLGRHFLFMRPRRFGKSILTTQLELYYDRIRARSHAMLFEGLEVGAQTSSEAHAYYAVRFDFNFANADLGTGSIQSEFRNRIRSTLQEFFLRYWQELPELARQFEALPSALDPAERLRLFLELMAGTHYPVYLIVDGFDSFALDLIAHDDLETYQELTRQGGFVHALVTVMLEGMAQGRIRRSFFAGVSGCIHRELLQNSPLMTDLSREPDFQGMVGWSEDEVVQAIEHTLDSERFSLEMGPLKKALAQAAGGYLFAPGATTRVYNPDIVVYFLMGLEPPDILPDTPFDLNLHTEVNRLKYLLMNADGRPRVALRELLGRLVRKRGLPIPQGLPRPMAEIYESEPFSAHLCALGLLTLGDEGQLVIPNGAIWRMYWETMAWMLQRGGRVGIHITPLMRAAHRLIYQGDAHPLFTLILGHGINRLVSRAGWQGAPLTGDALGLLEALWAFLCLTDLFQPLHPLEPVVPIGTDGAQLLALAPGAAHPEATSGLLVSVRCDLEGKTSATAETLLEQALTDLSVVKFERSPTLGVPPSKWLRVAAAVTLEGALYCLDGGEVQRPSSV